MAWLHSDFSAGPPAGRSVNILPAKTLHLNLTSSLWPNGLTHVQACIALMMLAPYLYQSEQWMRQELGTVRFCSTLRQALLVLGQYLQFFKCQACCTMAFYGTDRGNLDFILHFSPQWEQLHQMQSLTPRMLVATSVIVMINSGVAWHQAFHPCLASTQVSTQARAHSVFMRAFRL